MKVYEEVKKTCVRRVGSFISPPHTVSFAGSAATEPGQEQAAPPRRNRKPRSLHGGAWRAHTGRGKIPDSSDCDKDNRKECQ